MTVSFRPETPEDELCLRELIMEAVSQELGADSWPEPMRSHLLGIQYTQRRYAVRVHYPEGESRIILADGKTAGWIYVAALPDEIRIAEIMVMAGSRSRGVGSEVIRRIVAEAGPSGKPVRLHVNVMNVRAASFYERLGFQRIGGDELQHLMERLPSAEIC
jgi:ribosomal protein S18 acetylase RimI-like enzyme